MATRFHIKWKEHQWHTRTGCSQVFCFETRQESFTLRRHSAAAEAVLAVQAAPSPPAPAKCYWDWPVGLKVGITDRCLKEISTVRSLVQVKSFFQLILLFVPSELPLLLLLRTSNGFSPNPLPVLFCCQWQQHLHQTRCKYKQKTLLEHYCIGSKHAPVGTHRIPGALFPRPKLLRHTSSTQLCAPSPSPHGTVGAPKRHCSFSLSFLRRDV